MPKSEMLPEIDWERDNDINLRQYLDTRKAIKANGGGVRDDLLKNQRVYTDADYQDVQRDPVA